jgi:ubiquinol-cytochrome c reductase cytochrome c1 subunit
MKRVAGLTSSGFLACGLFVLMLSVAPVAVMAADAAAPAADQSAAPSAEPTGAPVTTDPNMSKASTAPQENPQTGTSESASQGDVGASSPAKTDSSAAGASNNSGAAAAATEEVELPNIKWSFDGPLGTYDRGALQRGFQIYSQVCSACHSMNRLSYRNLTALGYSEDEVKAIAASHQVTDINDEGESAQRPGLPSDTFVAPFPNQKAAAAANNGAVPPDMSLLAKAREGGPTYIYSILNGYEPAPAGASVPKGRYWNKYMAGHVIAMPPPLQAGQVTYEDGSPETLDQYAKDVATFLAWASEPHLEERHQDGIKAMIFLLVFAGIMYGVKKKVWTDQH